MGFVFVDKIFLRFATFFFSFYHWLFCEDKNLHVYSRQGENEALVLLAICLFYSSKAVFIKKMYKICYACLRILREHFILNSQIESGSFVEKGYFWGVF